MPRFDLHCNTCGGDSEVIAPDIAAIVCGCGSVDVEHIWSAPPMFKLMWEVNGTTPGVRKYAMDITRKAYEKQAQKAGVSHMNPKRYY